MVRTSPIVEAISKLLSIQDFVSSTEVAQSAGVTRQAAHLHLRRLVDEGVLVTQGSHRSSRYRYRADLVSQYDLESQTEHDIWTVEKSALKRIDPDLVEGELHRVLNFTFTEMVNNAIDHSGGRTLMVRWIVGPTTITFEVDDDGKGAFSTLRESRGLENNFQAIGELSKGKQTSAPDRHSGLGIFLTSRMAQEFTMVANEYSWKQSTKHHDYAIGALPRVKLGTLVRCTLDRLAPVSLQEVMRSVSDPQTNRLNQTLIRVKLFEDGLFISRTEAKLIGARLEGFEQVELDFDGVDSIGQGFADELFRIWARQNEGINIVVTNANHAVAAMIDAVRG